MAAGGRSFARVQPASTSLHQMLLCGSLVSFAIATSSPLIIPRPKETNLSWAKHPLPPVTVVCGKSRLDKTAAEVIVRELVLRGHKRPAIRHFPPQAGSFIALGEPSRHPWLQLLLGRKTINVPRNQQGYLLVSQPTERAVAVIAGRTPQATLYGAQTFGQLLEDEGPAIVLREGRIRDWPSLQWRGVHLFLGNTALPFHQKLITNALSRYKINRLVLQCEQAKWDALGDVAPDWGMSKSDLSKELRYARDRGVEPVPLVNSCGHMQWLLKDSPYRSLAEDPKQAFNICPTDPKTSKILDQIYGEVVKTFESKEFHIGGDEINWGGRYPYRSAPKYKRLCDLYVAHVSNLQGMLRRRGVKTMMWGDLMLSKDDVASIPMSAPSKEQSSYIREKLSDKVTNVDWHYKAGGEDERLAVLEASGYDDVIGATWRDPEAIQKYSEALTRRGHRGLLQTTWVGYNSQEKNAKSAGHNFWNFIVAAEMSWNGGSVPVDKLGYNPAELFWKVYPMPIRVDGRNS